MSLYAKIDSNNNVENIIVCEDSQISSLSGAYIKSTDSTGVAGIGMTWRPDKNKFVKIKPFESWTLNEETLSWEAPVNKPETGSFIWDDSSQQWVELTGNTEE